MKENFLSSYLRPHVWTGALATLLAMLLGGVAAVLATLVGPTLQLFSQGDLNQSFDLQFLLGETLGRFVADLFHLQKISVYEFLSVAPLLLVVLAFVKALLGAWQWYLWERTGERVAKSLRKDLVETFLILDPAQLLERDGKRLEGELAASVSSDIKVVRDYVVRFYGGLPREGIQVLFLGFAAFALAPRMFLFFFCALLPIALLMARFAKKIRKRMRVSLDDYAALSEWLQQRFLNTETIKQSGSEGVELQKMAILNANVCQRFTKALRTKARVVPVIEFMGACALAAVLYFVLEAVLSGEMSASTQLSFFSNLLFLVQSGSKLGKYFNFNREGSAATQRLQEIFTTLHTNTKPQLNAVALKEKNDSGGTDLVLQCNDLGFSYPAQSSNALRHVSFALKSSAFYALKGPSGAGKSTLVRVILGLLEPTHGSYRWQGLRKSTDLIYMPQNLPLGPFSIIENVVYPEDLNTCDQVRAIQSLKEVGLFEWIQSLPEKEHTVLALGATNVSGGQEQRIKLARVLYFAPQMIVVDEATSALDPSAEKLILSKLKALVAKGTTVLAIAHRSAAIEAADTVLEMQRGTLEV